MTEFLLQQIERVTVPQEYRRDRAVKPAGQAPDSHLRYDFDTFFYAAVRVGNDIVLVAPKLLNFSQIFRASRFSVAGKPVRKVKIYQFYRHAIIWLRGAANGSVLRVEFPGGATTETRILPQNLEFLANLNCQMIISKDNDLRWIREQLTFHARACDVRGLCFIDNGSTAYDLNMLRDVLVGCGFEKVVLMSMPFAWGGTNIRPVNRELYLQTAAYNLARLQFLAQARAVVRLDADEMLIPKASGDTVFDHAVRSRLGFVRFVGNNRYPSMTTEPPFQFADHDLLVAGQDVAVNNWCVNPRGPLGRFQWRCHNLEHNIFDKFQMLEGRYFYHCMGIGTGWKSMTRHRSDAEMAQDPEAAAFWRDQFRPVLAATDDV